MNREIKFRAWDPRAKAMEFTPNLELWWNENGSLDFDEFTLMQYTGLKDKNGVEIYEGDIVADYDADGIHVVEYHEDCFCLVRYSWSEARDLKRRSPSESEWWDTLEVIGNIYENPELLND